VSQLAVSQWAVSQLAVSRRSMRFGVAGIVPGQVVSTSCSVDVRVIPLAVSPWFGGMFFMNVNQVLVRLWARCGRKSDRMWSVLREGSSCGVGPPAAVAMCSEASVVC
jgi:hypothetical protein